MGLDIVSYLMGKAAGGGGGQSAYAGTLIGTYSNSTHGGAWYDTGHDATNDTEYVVVYMYNGNPVKVITARKSDVINPPNGEFLNIASELAPTGVQVAATGFNMRIADGNLSVSFGATGTGYSAKVYTGGDAISYFASVLS